MTHKPLIFSDHAALRMRERGFTRTDVKALLYQGEVSDSSIQKGQGFRHARDLKIRGALARIIFVETARVRIVVTVEWVDR